jgi:hypothetical protein
MAENAVRSLVVLMTHGAPRSTSYESAPST